jgi:hypothetical protein
MAANLDAVNNAILAEVAFDDMLGRIGLTSTHETSFVKSLVTVLVMILSR